MDILNFCSGHPWEIKPTSILRAPQPPADSISAGSTCDDNQDHWVQWSWWNSKLHLMMLYSCIIELGQKMICRNTIDCKRVIGILATSTYKETILYTVNVISHPSAVTGHRLYLDSSSRCPEAVTLHDPPYASVNQPSSTFLRNTEPGSYYHLSYTADTYMAWSWPAYGTSSQHPGNELWEEIWDRSC